VKPKSPATWLKSPRSAHVPRRMARTSVRASHIGEDGQFIGPPSRAHGEKPRAERLLEVVVLGRRRYLSPESEPGRGGSCGRCDDEERDARDDYEHSARATCQSTGLAGEPALFRSTAAQIPARWTRLGETRRCCHPAERAGGNRAQSSPSDCRPPHANRLVPVGGTAPRAVSGLRRPRRPRGVQIRRH
jgi:hypothetical protein